MFNEDHLTRQEIKKLQKLIKKAPLLFARLGEYYMRLGDYDHAGPILERGAEEFPDYVSGCLLLSEYYLYKGLYRDAEEAAFQGLQRQPNHLGLLQLLVKIKKGQDYLNDINQIKGTLNALDPLYQRGAVISGENTSTPEALDQIPVETQILTSPSSVWKIKAAAHHKEKVAETYPPESDLAEMNLERNLDAPEDLPSVQIPQLEAAPAKPKIATKTLGELYAKQNNFKEAIEIYEALALNEPDNQIYQRRLEELKQRQGTLAGSQKD